MVCVGVCVFFVGRKLSLILKRATVTQTIVILLFVLSSYLSGESDV